MSLSDADYALWLASDATERCILVEMEYRDSGGSTVTAYLSTGPFVSGPGDTPANQSYSAVIVETPVFAQTMSDVLYGRTTPNVGAIVLDNGDGAFDGWITQNFSGRALRMYLGGPTWDRADFRSVWTGVISTLTVNGTNALTVQTQSREHLMSQMVTATKITTGDSAGKYRPLCYGTCTNVPAMLIDNATHKYAVNTADVYAISQVRMDGVALDGADWTDNSDGTFSLDYAASGQVTADVQGMYSGGTLFQYIKEIVKDICVTRGPFVEADFDTTTWTNLNTTFPQKLGLFMVQPRPINELMDEICGSVGAFYYVNRDGKIVIKQFSLSGTATLSIGVDQIAAHGLSITGVLQPMDKLKRGYARNWTQQEGNQADTNLDVTRDGTGYVTDVVYDGIAPTRTGAVTEANRERYRNRYSWKLAENAGAANILKRVEPAMQGTLLTDATECNTEATRWLALFSAPRVKYGLRCFTDGALVNLGDRVQITHPRYGLADGVTGTVIAVRDHPARHEQYLEIMV